MTLYEEIKKIEHRQEMDATLSLFNLRDEALNLLQQPAYRKNWLAIRMEEGQKLEAMAQQLIDDRRYTLKFKENKREEYNLRVQELAEITTYARHLRCHPFLSWHAPEGGALRGGIAAVLFSGCMVATGSRQESVVVAGTVATILLGSLIGTNTRHFSYGHPSYQRPKMWEEIRYIDNIIQKR